MTPIDLATGQIEPRISLGKQGAPGDIAITPDGAQAFVVDGPADEVSVIDLATDRDTRTIQMGLAPDGIVIAP